MIDALAGVNVERGCGAFANSELESRLLRKPWVWTFWLWSQSVFEGETWGLPWLHVPLHFGVFTSLFYLGRGWGTWGFPVDAPCVAFTAGTLSCTSQGTVGICVGDFSQDKKS